MTLTDAEIAYLTTQPLGRLATCRVDGSLQVSPVGFRYDDQTGTIEITGRALGQTRKFANVEDNGQVALVVDDLVSRSPWVVRGVEVRGTAAALRDQVTESAYTSDEIIRIHPGRVISWGLDPDDPSTRGRDVRESAATGIAP